MAEDEEFLAPKDDSDLGYWPDGRPTLITLGNALLCWISLQHRPVSVPEAAITFNLPPAKIDEAVEFHPFLLLGGTSQTGERLIEMDGY